MNNSENIFTSRALKNAICHQTCNNKIPTIINGIIKNSDIQNSSKIKSIPPRAKPDKSIRCHRKADIIGDSHPSSFYYIPLYRTDMEQVSNIMQYIKHIVITYINNHNIIHNINMIQV